MILDVGRVCVKTAGREAGRACVVIDTIDETYVMITGPKSLTRVRRRKCNIAHLEPLEFQLKLAKNAGDTEVAKLLQAEKILEKLTSGKPVARPERPREQAPKEEKAKEKEKKGLRERILGRAKKEEKPEKPKEKPKKEERPKEEKKPEKPKEKPKKPVKAAKKPAKKATKKKSAKKK